MMFEITILSSEVRYSNLPPIFEPKTSVFQQNLKSFDYYSIKPSNGAKF